MMRLGVASLAVTLVVAGVQAQGTHADVVLTNTEGGSRSDYHNGEYYSYIAVPWTLANVQAWARTEAPYVSSLSSVDQVSWIRDFTPHVNFGRARAFAHITDQLWVRHPTLPTLTPIKVEMRSFGVTNFRYTSGTNIYGSGGASFTLTCGSLSTGYARSTQMSPISHPPVIINTYVGANLNIHGVLSTEANAKVEAEGLYGQALTFSDAIVYMTPEFGGWCESTRVPRYPRWHDPQLRSPR